MMPNRQYDFIFVQLGEKFPDEKVLEKKTGKPHYITARQVMNRLDTVLGPANWWDEYTNISDTSAICRLTIRLPDGQEITKCDAGGSAGMADGGDDDKSIISDAFKRAAVKFGVGRYLRGDGIPDLSSKPVEVPVTAVQQPVVASRQDEEKPDTLPVTEKELETHQASQGRTEPEPKGMNGNPFKPETTFWNDILSGVANANTGWLADFPDSEEVVTTDAVLMKLAELTYSAQVQPVAPDAKEVQGKPMTMARWAGVMNKVARKSPEMHEWLKSHMEAFIREQVSVARKLQKV